MLFGVPTHHTPSVSAPHYNTSGVLPALSEMEVQRLRDLYEERVAKMVVDLVPTLGAALRDPVVHQLAQDSASAAYLRDHVAEVTIKELRGQLEAHNHALMRALSVKTTEVETLKDKIIAQERLTMNIKREAELEIRTLQDRLGHADRRNQDLEHEVSHVSRAANSTFASSVRSALRAPSPQHDYSSFMGPGSGTSDEGATARHRPRTKSRDRVPRTPRNEAIHHDAQYQIIVRHVLSFAEGLLTDGAKSSLLERLPQLVGAAYDVCGNILDCVSTSETISTANDSSEHILVGNVRQRISVRRVKVLQELQDIQQGMRYLRRLARDKERETQDLQRQLQSVNESYHGVAKDIETAEVAHQTMQQENEELLQRMSDQEQAAARVREERSLLLASCQYVIQSMGSLDTTRPDFASPTELGRVILKVIGNYQSQRAHMRRHVQHTIERTLATVRALRSPLLHIRTEVVSMQHTVVSGYSHVQRLVQTLVQQSTVMQSTVEAVLNICSTLVDIPGTLRADLSHPTHEVNVSSLESFARLIECFRNKTVSLHGDVDRLRQELTLQRNSFEEQAADWEVIQSNHVQSHAVLNSENASLTARVQHLSRRLEEEEKTHQTLRERYALKEAENSKLHSLAVQRSANKYNNISSLAVGSASSPSARGGLGILAHNTMVPQCGVMQLGHKDRPTSPREIEHIEGTGSLMAAQLL